MSLAEAFNKTSTGQEMKDDAEQTLSIADYPRRWELVDDALIGM